VVLCAVFSVPLWFFPVPCGPLRSLMVFIVTPGIVNYNSNHKIIIIYLTVINPCLLSTHANIQNDILVTSHTLISTKNTNKTSKTFYTHVSEKPHQLHCQLTLLVYIVSSSVSMRSLMNIFQTVSLPKL